MRKMWKIALAVTLVVGFWGAVAQAQPIITGNTAAFGNGPINSWNFTLDPCCNRVGTFIPDSAVPSATNKPNGRGLAVGGERFYYTELSGVDGFGPSDGIHQAPFNAGAGGADILPKLDNPRPGFGIQDLTISPDRVSGSPVAKLFSLTGYPDQSPEVWVQNLDGSTARGGVAIPFPASTDSDGFAILPDTGNFLINRGDTSCIYDEYDASNGAFIGRTINVPGNVSICTGVDTDGTSLYFMTDFESIVQTDLFGNLTGFKTVQGNYETEDISLIHPVTTITEVGTANLFFSRISSDDNSVKFEMRAELLRKTPADTTSGTVIATGLSGCMQLTNQGTAKNVALPMNLPGPIVLGSGDVLSMQLSTRHCTGGSAVGIRFYYDSSTFSPSQMPITIAPNPSLIYFFHSDGTPCQSGGTVKESATVTSRTLSAVPPSTNITKCKHSDALTGGAGWFYFKVPTNTAGSTPALWSLNQ